MKPVQTPQPVSEIAQASPPTAAEFFAGIGLARIGLEGAGIEVVWSNDLEPAKRDMYVGHFRGNGQRHEFALGDVADVAGSVLPDGLDLAWASFPCTDLSLAGWRRGLQGRHSSTFWHFTRVLAELGSRRPGVIALENVTGFSTSHGGADLAEAVRALNRLGYSVDVLTLDARRFVPQSRPRLFVVGCQDVPQADAVPVSTLRPHWLQAPFEDPSLITHRALLPEPPPLLKEGLSSTVECVPDEDDRWWDTDRTRGFLESLSGIQTQRLERLITSRDLSYRTAYRRTRHGVAVWEIRADDLSGCLRTARGGSSKQAIVTAGQGQVRCRWMTPREYARLMGAGEYRLEGVKTNQALFGFGDAVCVPAIDWLARHYLMPLLRPKRELRPDPSLAAVGV